MLMMPTMMVLMTIKVLIVDSRVVLVTGWWGGVKKLTMVGIVKMLATVMVAVVITTVITMHPPLCHPLPSRLFLLLHDTQMMTTRLIQVYHGSR